jgi:deoxyribose-phosphate aldolase
MDPRAMESLVDSIAERVRRSMGSSPRSEEALFHWQYGAGWNANAELITHHEVYAASRIDSSIARRIDHTLLKPEATREEVVQLCLEAKRYGFFSVCVNSANVELCAGLLAGSGTVPICVVGFPLGASLASVKAFEAKEAIRLGAKEIDTVINIGALKSGDFQTVLDDLRLTVEASRPYPLKVILETSKLTQEEKVAACVLSREARAAFVKTSTGFGGGGATVEDIRLMKRVVGAAGMQVKASGGVRNTEQAWKLVEAGADRLGASSSVQIVTGGEAKGSY